MTSEESTGRKPLRLWPGVVIVAMQWLIRFGAPFVVPESGFIGVMAGLAGGLAVVVWWAFFSRASRFERWAGMALLIGGLLATPYILHRSIATGMRGMMFAIYAIPILSLAFIIWAAASRSLSEGLRRATMVATILLVCGAWTLLRIDGITGDGAAQFAWRWSQTHEDRFLARVRHEPTAPTSSPVTEKPSEERLPASKGPLSIPTSGPSPLAVHPKEPSVDWNGFRGPNRDGIVRGVRIRTDWSASPPVELWRRPIGPGWSSFAVQGDTLFTQEQHGEEEIVASYRLADGRLVWTHRDTARFWESHGGAGPRGTPALSNGRVYTFGATGLVNALDANDGSVVWSRNAATDTNTKVPGWGFASSPLVVDDVVIVAVSSKLAAYDRAKGDVRWLGQPSGGSFSSPHLLTIDGVPQVLLMSAAGATSFGPADGKVLWQHAWPGSTIIQPAAIGDGDILISTTDAAGGLGMRRLKVTRGSNGWTVEERWTSAGLKPYFNDFVVHDGHAFGFDGRILSCIDLVDGKRKWKGGRYGNGQLVLLPEQDLLLVLSEEGELALVKATSDNFAEVARFPAIEGKTWNHPVLIGDTVLARNGEQMAAFRLSLADR
jgi:outer membrane protein assembly factor BamB